MSFRVLLVPNNSSMSLVMAIHIEHVK